ncbi:PREDICTED: probable ATP-dependent RNA helicase DDX52 [Thamnophis sirtalis]|uniref:Probable ATP-dependent RNA helicase DDX52 n=1 Tax=Thamnophis sirtalis TaxID=35019 RepID=A0A6I9YXG4_9SAUR|nr:PREDICTED: probable ATP-dependent RNA helicase DDX52 [Thamnophis sirtalis]
MDAHELFRKLGAGAKFDVRRFRRDAERFGVLRTKEETTKTSEILGSLDFFGKKRKENELHEAQIKTLELSNLPLEEVAAPQKTQAAKKRKGDGQSTKERRKKKKGQETVAVIPGTENDGILWMSTLEAKLDIPKSKGKKGPKSQKLKQIRQEKINHFRNMHKIYIQGTDLPDPITSFEELGREYKIHSKIMQNVEAAGFQSPTPIQMQAIPVMLHGRELLACAPTGSGKTLAFSIPILTHLKQPMNKGFRALVLSPTRELASQTHRELLKLSEGIGFRIHLIHKAAETAKKFGPKSSQKFDILVTTPNRLIYLLKQDPPAIDLTRNAAVETVDQELLFVGSETGKLLAMRDLVKKGFTPPVLVFVQSIERAKELFHELVYEGINVDVIHADRTQQQRDNVVRSFRAGKIWVLICTALLARGIDFKGVNMVINFDFPSSAVEYIHRIGRTGRAGHTGKAITFFTEDDKPLLRSIASIIQRAGCPVPDYIKHFRKLQSKQKKKFTKKPLERAHILTSLKFLQKKAKKNKTLVQKMKKNSKEVQSNNSQKQATPEN